jgi:hypothetical protein
VERGSGLVLRGPDLHRREVQQCREDHFLQGGSLNDHSGLLNSSLEGNKRRAIDFHEGDVVNEKAMRALIKAAVDLNISGRT